MKLVIIMRGIPGSGKSTLARMLTSICGVVHSTDDYFLRAGRYLFNPAKLAEAHAWNLAQFKQSLAQAVPVVVCDNTNTTKREYAPYVTAAQQMGYEVCIIALPHPEPEEAVRRSIHHVPLTTIKRMIARWEPESAA